MKQVITATLLLFVSIFAAAQSSDKFNSAMQKGILMLDSARNSEDFTANANYFERIATAEAGEWLPKYYSAYALLMSANAGRQDNDTKDVIYDKAFDLAEKAAKIKPDNSEILTLQGYIVFMKVSLAPQARAMTLIPKSGALLEKAIAIDPKNPRALLVKGQNLFYTPEAFGGGKAKAKDVLVLSLEKYGNEKAGALMPSWGKSRCEALLNQVK
ncbi:MAG: hypothetical protein ABW036_08220 [Flavitalea sp.]